MRRKVLPTVPGPVRASRQSAAKDLRLQPEEAEATSRALTAGEIALNLDELSQPLTAILATALAMQRAFRKSPAADRDVEEAIADVTGQAFRAAKIVHRMRKIVQRREARKSRPG